MTHPAGDAATPPDQPDEDAQHYRRVLHTLIDNCAIVADRITQQTETATAQQLPALAAALDRTARNIRRSIMLARQCTEPGSRRTATRRQIIRAVEDSIERDAHPAEADTLQAELLDRLDTPDFDEDLLTRPTADIITEIRHDLGLTDLPGITLYKRRTPADLAVLRAYANEPTAETPRPARTAHARPGTVQSAPAHPRAPPPSPA